MNKAIFVDGTECVVSAVQKNKNLIKLVGDDIPQDTSGFVITRDFGTKVLDYKDYTTLYKIDPDGITFSNDESVYTRTVKVCVVWSDFDNYDGIRPESVDVFVSKDGEEFETIELSSANEWKKEYTDSVIIPQYTVDGEGIQAYEKTVNGLIINYFHQAEIPVPPPTPNLEERVANLETDMENLNYVIGGMVE